MGLPTLPPPWQNAHWSPLRWQFQASEELLSHITMLIRVLRDSSAATAQGEAKAKPYPRAAEFTDLGLKPVVSQRTDHERAMGRC